MAKGCYTLHAWVLSDRQLWLGIGEPVPCQFYKENEAWALTSRTTTMPNCYLLAVRMITFKNVHRAQRWSRRLVTKTDYALPAYTGQTQDRKPLRQARILSQDCYFLQG